MVKPVVCVKRKPDMGVDEFHHYWRTAHGNLIKSLPSLRNYVRKYVQSHTLAAGYTRNAAPLDGIAELWFDDYSAAFLSDPDYLAHVRPDELKFTDHPNPVWFVTQEEHVIDGSRVFRRAL